MKIYVYICCFIFFALASQGAEFDLGTHGTLSVTVPDGWSVNGKAANRPDGTSIGYQRDCCIVVRPRGGRRWLQPTGRSHRQSLLVVRPPEGSADGDD